ncbi:MAG: cobyric acid synthase [Aestuariivita sp.]|nr:cobyric acid synthase [Aestuariivita sp.]
MTRAIMIQGTGSNVGKSLIVAGLARAFSKRGFSVAPFKPQNMSNNAAVTQDGGEIGRAQALQAKAAGIAPISDMNPILLKPETDTGAQLIVRGKRIKQQNALTYMSSRRDLLPVVKNSFKQIAQGRELVLIEGAGSPAETNLRKGDIANMGFATELNIPVILVGDIERGGVSAQIVGTHTVLNRQDQSQICGFGINKFRGEIRLLDDLLRDITQRTSWPNFGVIPWFNAAWKLPAEDIMDIKSQGSGDLIIAVPQFARISNFDDLDPLAAEPSIQIKIIKPGRPIPGNANLVMLLGSKSTISDLAFLRAQGWDVDIAAHIRRGGHLIGLCGGFQMLGQTIEDPNGIEGKATKVNGLGYLEIKTILTKRKRLANQKACCTLSNSNVEGYEIHMGRSTGNSLSKPWFKMDGKNEGAIANGGQIKGTYLHGIFISDEFRASFLNNFGQKSQIAHDDEIEKTLNDLSKHLETYMNLDHILKASRVIN